MQRTPFDSMACSIARSLDVAGEWWTPLIVRDVYLGLRRFEEIQRNLQMSRKVLAQRLETLTANGVLERRLYQERPERFEYVLTQKGRELAVVLMALMAWGDRWQSDGAPLVLRHAGCGHDTTATVACGECGEPLVADEVLTRPGPGARSGPGTTEIARLAAERAAQRD